MNQLETTNLPGFIIDGLVAALSGMKMHHMSEFWENLVAKLYVAKNKSDRNHMQ